MSLHTVREYFRFTLNVKSEPAHMSKMCSLFVSKIVAKKGNRTNLHLGNKWRKDTYFLSIHYSIGYKYLNSAGLVKVG